MNARSSRRTLLVQKRFQLKYMLVMVVAGAAISLLFGAIMVQAHVEVSDLAGLPKTTMDERDRVVLGLVAATAVLLAGTLVVFGLLVTHRVAGPIFVLGRYMKLLGEGRYPLLRPLRRDDEMQELHETFRDAIEKMRARDLEDAELLRVAVEKLEPMCEHDAQEAIASLRALMARKREAASEPVAATESVRPPRGAVPNRARE